MEMLMLHLTQQQKGAKEQQQWVMELVQTQQLEMQQKQLELLASIMGNNCAPPQYIPPQPHQSSVLAQDILMDDLKDVSKDKTIPTLAIPAYTHRARKTWCKLVLKQVQT
eukprot:695167-Ditylum_brightwellii.AAC.2